MVLCIGTSVVSYFTNSIQSLARDIDRPKYNGGLSDVAKGFSCWLFTNRCIVRWSGDSARRSISNSKELPALMVNENPFEKEELFEGVTRVSSTEGEKTGIERKAYYLYRSRRLKEEQLQNAQKEERKKTGCSELRE